MPGQVTDFNMWNYEMTLAQINSVGCTTNGNVVTWDTLVEVGRAKRSDQIFPECSKYFNCSKSVFTLGIVLKKEKLYVKE